MGGAEESETMAGARHGGASWPGRNASTTNLSARPKYRNYVCSAHLGRRASIRAAPGPRTIFARAACAFPPIPRSCCARCAFIALPVGRERTCVCCRLHADPDRGARRSFPDPPPIAIHRIRGRGHDNKKMLGPVKGCAVMISPWWHVQERCMSAKASRRRCALWRRRTAA